MKLWKKLRLIMPLTLLLMILMRLVWLQIRVYPYELSLTGDSTFTVLDAISTADCRLPVGKDYYGRSGAGPIDDQSSGTTARRERPGDFFEVLRALLRGSLFYMGIAELRCQSGLTSAGDFGRLNQWFLVMTVVFASLTVRFLTSSWIVALIAAVTLLSRGHMLSHMGEISPHPLISMLIAAWLASVTHYMRTGSRASLLASGGLAILSTFADRSLFALCLVMPAALMSGMTIRRGVMRSFLARIRDERRRQRQLRHLTRQKYAVEGAGTVGHRVMDYMRLAMGLEGKSQSAGTDVQNLTHRGSLFRSLAMPFFVWVSLRRRMIVNLVYWAAVCIATAVFMVITYSILVRQLSQIYGESFTFESALFISSVSRDWIQIWLWQLIQAFDLHFVVSLLVILLCSLQSPMSGMRSFFEGAWVFLLVCAMLALTAAVSDFVDLRFLNDRDVAPVLDQSLDLLRPVMRWLEPMVLAYGIAGVYHLLKIAMDRNLPNPK